MKSTSVVPADRCQPKHSKILFGIWLLLQLANPDLIKAQFVSHLPPNFLSQYCILSNDFPLRYIEGLDSLQSEVKKPRKLIPANLGPLETILWSERGWVRRANLAPLNIESRKKELTVRRAMLTTHQIAGLFTLTSMIATVVVGQKIIDGNNSLSDTHGTLAGLTIFGYITTASLALLSPPPQIRRREWSTVSTHKLLAWFHLVGMIATPMLADGIGGREELNGAKINISKARVHQIAGYFTTATFAAAVISITF